jgi:hypothetical protein
VHELATERASLEDAFLDVGQHPLDQTLSETAKVNLDIRAIRDVATFEVGGHLRRNARDRR